MMLISTLLGFGLIAASLILFPSKNPLFQFRSNSQTPPNPHVIQQSNNSLRVPILPDKLKPKPKVFVIGLSKTGTTSLGDALARLSYTRVGWQDIRSRFLFRSWTRHDLSPLIAMANMYEAFEDLPWAMVYAEMATIFPDAKFILTLRRSDEVWLKSILDHTDRRIWDGHRVIYGATRGRGHEEAYLKAYKNHTESVRKYFSSSGEAIKGSRLLEFIIDAPESEEEKERGDRWSVLLRFLDMDDGQETRKVLGEFPKSNGKTSWGNRDPFRFWWTLDRITYHGEDLLVGVLEWQSWLSNLIF
ncbi:hypothetical protein B7463_g6775, partial [Scytalidium lignicola]